MTSIQERLQLKRVPLDVWNTREKLCLASAVLRSGDQNWMSVSRALKTVGESNRPPDWYSQKSCAAQYGALLENVETPKRKKRSSEGAVETPQESIHNKLTQERIVEIQKNLAEMNQQYEQLSNEIKEVNNPATSEERLRELWADIEATKRARERESLKRAAYLKEREERRIRSERSWRPSAPTTPTGSTVSPASPLLTSLLKSSPVVTTPQHIPHPAGVVDSVSPSAGAPTLSMLLEKTATSDINSQESKHAIEQIKSQLVQIEQQLKASPAPVLDIDEIEIKAEDVYAFRDIDLHIPPVATMHKQPNRVPDKPVLKKDEDELTSTPTDDVTVATEQPDHSADNVTKVSDAVPTEPFVQEIPVSTPGDFVVENDTVPPEVSVQTPEAEETVQPKEEANETPTPEVTVVFPEVKFPSTEIKVIPPEEVKVMEVKTEVVKSEPEPEPEPEPLGEVEPVEIKETEDEVNTANREDFSSEETGVKTDTIVAADETVPASDVPETVEPEPEVPAILDAIPLPPQELTSDSQLLEETQIPPADEIPLPIEPKEPVAADQLTQEPVEEKPDTAEKQEEIKKEPEDVEDSIPLKEMIKETTPAVQETEVQKTEQPEPEEVHTETDDDTPMELSREEEKDGKKKRDYSRKKKPNSRTCSGSESAAETSAPDSPSTNDAEIPFRAWKKSVMTVFNRLGTHKYASLFQRPISDEEAPDYSIVVRRPMDLSTIKKNIESGAIRTTAEFQRDVLLMLSNALMYNSSEHSVYQMTQDMYQEAVSQLNMLVAAHAHAGLTDVPARRKRRYDPGLHPVPASSSPASSPAPPPAKRQHTAT